ncbi:MAG TPA: hypothetical protein VNA11_09090, partial [Pseudonocardia sp.]|nr:hypothetical protein [Pseudonocardia sp.]
MSDEYTGPGRDANASTDGSRPVQHPVPAYAGAAEPDAAAGAGPYSGGPDRYAGPPTAPLGTGLPPYPGGPGFGPPPN